MIEARAGGGGVMSRKPAKQPKGPSAFTRGTEPNWSLIAKALERDDVAIINFVSSIRSREKMRDMLREFNGNRGHVRLAFTARAMGYAERQSTRRGKPAHLSVVIERVRSIWGGRLAAGVAGNDVDAWALVDKLEPYFTKGWDQGATENGKRRKRAVPVDRAIQTLMTKEKVFGSTFEADRQAIDRAEAVVRQAAQIAVSRYKAAL
jgi:hypothetical protein